MTKQTIRVKIDHFEEWFEMSDLSGTPEKIRQTLEIIDRKAHELGYVKPKVEFEHYGYDGGLDVLVTGERLETDKEYQKRLAVEEIENKKSLAAKNAKEKKERKQYEELKKKFEQK